MLSHMDSTDKTHRQPKRSKKAARVDRELEALKAASAEGANVPEVASATEEAVKDATEAGDTTGPQTEFTRGQLGKTKRAFAKAGKADENQEVRPDGLPAMTPANHREMGFTSSR